MILILATVLTIVVVVTFSHELVMNGRSDNFDSIESYAIITTLG